MIQHKHFKIIESKTIDSGNSEAIRMQHSETGLNVLYVKNKDKNKVFYTAFRTPPFDNSGAAHILEHSVLCGSKKYQAKDLFNELMKGSVNTYLNAMTFSDKTMYPVASLSHKDFYNLMEVYLDAVFHPMLYETPEFFDIEGWNYAISKKTDPIEIKGIVYNEMKGAYASAERVLIKKIDELLYASSPYQYDSGGVPAAIPTLSYEKLLAFHKKYYAPSNCLAFLYGDLDINHALKLLDDSVKGMAKIRPPKVSLSPLLKEADFPKSELAYYSVHAPKKDGAYHALSYIACPYNETDEMLALEILSHLLGGDDSSPLKMAVNKSGLCGNFSVYYRTSSYQTSFSLVGKNCKDDSFRAYQKLLRQALKDIQKNGFNKESVAAALNKWEFYVKEEDFSNQPRGLFYGVEAAASWVYGGEIYNAFDTKTALTRIRQQADEGLFERLFQKYFIDNPLFALTELLPKQHLMEEAENQLAQKLADLKKSQGDEKTKEMIRNTKALEQFRKKPAPSRALKKIPILQIADLPREIQVYSSATHKNALLLASDKEDIEYIHLHFDVSHLPAHLLPYCGLLRYMLGKTATPDLDAEALIRQINTYAGRISYTADALQNHNGSYLPRFNIKIRTLRKNTPRVLSLMAQILRPRWEDARIRQLLDETILSMENYFSASGHSAAATRCLAYLFPGSNYTDQTSGIGFYQEIAGKPVEEIKKALQEVCGLIFDSNQLFIGISAERDAESILEKTLAFASGLEPVQGQKAHLISPLSTTNEGFILDGGVSYNACAYNFYDALKAYDGSLQVARSVLNLTHLWNEIRNKGGAYGCGCGLSRSGMLHFYSYRDPEIEKTYEIFNRSFEALKGYKDSEWGFSKYVINAIKPFMRPFKGYEALDFNVSNHLLGITNTMRQQERDEILGTTITQINTLGESLSTLLKNPTLCCTLGAGTKINENPIFSATAALRYTSKTPQKNS